MMTKKLFTVLIALVVFMALAVSASPANITVVMDGENIPLDVPASVMTEKTLSDLTQIYSKLDCQIGWDFKTSELSIIKDKEKYKMLYAPGGRSRLFSIPNVNAQLSVGWYKNPELTDNTPLITLTMATNAYFAPYEYYKNGEIVGIDIEIARAIAEKLGAKLEIFDMQFDSILTVVDIKEADFGMAGMTATEYRLTRASASQPYLRNVQSIVVNKGSAIKTVDDLYADNADYRIGFLTDTTAEIYVYYDFGEYNTVMFADITEAVYSLKNGIIDCIILDYNKALEVYVTYEDIILLDTPYSDEEYVIYVSKNNDALLAEINAAISELKSDGTIDRIIKKYKK